MKSKGLFTFILRAGLGQREYELLPQLLSKEFWGRFAHLCFETCQRCEMRDKRRLLWEKVRCVSNYDFELLISTIWWNGAKNRNVI